jgi:catechol 2,3-dioxygenase-like lactoylglutathione lyase family enzyme
MVGRKGRQKLSDSPTTAEIMAKSARAVLPGQGRDLPPGIAGAVGSPIYLDVKIAAGGRVIHHVQLACPPGSEDALREFYGGVLGFQELAKPPVLAARGGCWFRGHGIELHLGVEQDFRPARKAHPGLLVRDLDAWADRLRAAHAPVRFDEDFPGMRRFYSEDPLGNRLEFLEPIDERELLEPADGRREQS